jgi:hypothetical protein
LPALTVKDAATISALFKALSDPLADAGFGPFLDARVVQFAYCAADRGGERLPAREGSVSCVGGG